MAETFNSYLKNKSSTVQPQQFQQAPLQHYEMWANFDRMIAKFDEDEVNDLNVTLTNAIGCALKEKRSRQK